MVLDAPGIERNCAVEWFMTPHPQLLIGNDMGTSPVFRQRLHQSSRELGGQRHSKSGDPITMGPETQNCRPKSGERLNAGIMCATRDAGQFEGSSLYHGSGNWDLEGK